MEFFAPIQITESEKDQFQGSFPFDSQIQVEGKTRLEVAQKLHCQVSSLLQSEKNPELIKKIQDFKISPEFDYIKLGLFSRGEQIVLCGLWFLVGMILFSIFILLCGFVYYQFHPLGGQALAPKLNEFFRAQLLGLSFAKSVLFLLFWNLFYVWLYPRFLRFWGTILLESSTMRTWYQNVLISWAGPKPPVPPEPEGGVREAQ
jgi:hypothetical protein